MRVLINAVKRENNQQIWVAILVFLFAACLLTYTWNKNILLVLFASGVTILGIKMCWEAFRTRKADDSPLLDLIFQHPDQIVWIYPVVTDRMPFGLQFTSNVMIHFRLLDGSTEVLGVAEKKKNALMNDLRSLLPNCTFGYSDEKERLYMIAPDSLIRKES